MRLSQPEKENVGSPGQTQREERVRGGKEVVDSCFQGKCFPLAKKGRANEGKKKIRKGKPISENPVREKISSRGGGRAAMTISSARGGKKRGRKEKGGSKVFCSYFLYKEGIHCIEKRTDLHDSEKGGGDSIQSFTFKGKGGSLPFQGKELGSTLEKHFLRRLPRIERQVPSRGGHKHLPSYSFAWGKEKPKISFPRTFQKGEHFFGGEKEGAERVYVFASDW